MKDKYKYEAYVPKTFSIGINEKHAGFPSMRNPEGNWTNLSIFEKHCKYKPTIQRDKRKEINKVLTQKVQTIENVPTSGFKLVSIGKYVYMTELYKDIVPVVLEDPRGWEVMLDTDNFNELLRRNGMNLKNGVLENIKLVYGWPLRSKGPFSLYEADSRALEMQDATAKLLSKKDETEYIKPSQFEIGKVYSSKVTKMAGHKYMYAGVHDTYSSDCQIRAVECGDYSKLDWHLDDKTDLTRKSQHVFYCLDLKIDNDSTYGIHNNTPGISPYFVIGSPSKLFEIVEDIDPAKYKMYNDPSKPATAENIKTDIETSTFFNKIDLEKSLKAHRMTAVEYKLLEDVFGCFYGWKVLQSASMKAFPFYCNSSFIFLQGKWSNFSISSHGPGYPSKLSNYTVHKAKAPGEYNYWNSSVEYAKYEFSTPEERKEAFKCLYADAMPRMLQYSLCNGKDVPPYQNLMLNRKMLTSAYYI